jgi:hypothetical protein
MLKPNLHRFFKHTCNGKYTKDDIDRFISKIDTTPGLGPNGDCWEWIGYLTPSGYGKFHHCNNGIETTCRPNRVALELSFGVLIRKDIYSLHKCDNPKCVYIVHLKKGTPKDNMDDMFAKGRGNRRGAIGERSHTAKLTWLKINKIRELYTTGEYTQRQLAEMFNVSHATIGCVVRNTTWIDSNHASI